MHARLSCDTLSRFLRQLIDSIEESSITQNFLPEKRARLLFRRGHAHTLENQVYKPMIRLSFTVPRSDKTRKREYKACLIRPESPNITVWITMYSLHCAATAHIMVGCYFKSILPWVLQCSPSAITSNKPQYSIPI